MKNHGSAGLAASRMTRQKSPKGDCMGTEISGLKRRLESVKTDALRFVEEIDEGIVTGPETSIQRLMGVWSGRREEDYARAEELRYRLRVFTLDLAMAMEHSPVLTKTDLRDIGRTGKRMCAALRFEQYTGSMVERGEPIRAIDAKFILENGFEAMTQWVDLAPDPIHGANLAG